MLELADAEYTVVKVLRVGSGVVCIGVAASVVDDNSVNSLTMLVNSVVEISALVLEK